MQAYTEPPDPPAQAENLALQAADDEPRIYIVSTLQFHGPGYGQSPRSIGWFETLDEATQCVRENWGDIYEHSYTYAVIEEVPPGVYGGSIGFKEHWFRWDRSAEPVNEHDPGAYVPCDKPKQVKGVVHFSIG